MASKLLRRVFALRLIGHRIERHFIGVVNEDEVIELVMCGKGDRFLRDAFLQTPVARDADDVVVENFVNLRIEARGGHFLGNSEPHRIGNALTKRPRGAFHPVSLMRFRMPGSDAAKSAEILQLIQRHQRVTSEVQPAVEEHGAMAGTQNEAVAIEPAGIFRIVAQGGAEEDRTDLRAPER